MYFLLHNMVIIGIFRMIKNWDLVVKIAKYCVREKLKIRRYMDISGIFRGKAIFNPMKQQTDVLCNQ